MKFRPTAIPLMTVDPYFSIWSCDDALYGGPTEQWNGTPCPIIAGFFIDNIFYSMSAFDVTGKKMKQRVYQTDVKITPLSSIYTFENDLVKCTLTFTTPLLLDRLDGADCVLVNHLIDAITVEQNRGIIKVFDSTFELEPVR